jgi:hypothetical protein
VSATLTTPSGGIGGLAVVTDFKIQAGRLLATTITNIGNGFIGFNPVANFLQQTLVMAIQTHVTVTMIQNDQQAIAS